MTRQLTPKIKVNGVNTYYAIEGDGQPLVFIHGLGSSTKDWENQIPLFSKSYKTVSYDLRGHGESSKPAGPYQIPMFADDLKELLRILETGAVHLVGLSLGGCIAFQFAIDHPELVRTLTIVNSAPRFCDNAEQAQKEVDRRVATVQQLGMRAMGKSLSGNLLPGQKQVELRRVFVERWSRNDPNAYIEATRSLLGWDVEKRLNLIKCPTLVIAADQDYTPVEAKSAYVKMMPNARLVVISNSHHFVPVERPMIFNKVLMNFLSSITSLRETQPSFFN